MAIKPSSAAQIESLVADLGAARGATREAAVARLTIIGARAVGRLVAIVESDASLVARVAALEALASIADPRALDPALRAVDTPEADVATAGISVARAFLHGPRGTVVVDRLTAVALDPARADTIRLSALEALGDLKPSTIAPVFSALRHDASGGIRRSAQRARSPHRSDTFNPAVILNRALDGALPEEPEGLRRAVTLSAKKVDLAQLLRLIERIREHESSQDGAARTEWMRVRGAAHILLAGRGSRIALYDLRETIESAATPLPVEFLAALSTIGDTSCLEGLATACARSMRGGSSRRDWWRQHLAEAFRAIIVRGRITRRHAMIKKIHKRWPEALAELLHEMA